MTSRGPRGPRLVSHGRRFSEKATRDHGSTSQPALAERQNPRVDHRPGGRRGRLCRPDRPVAGAAGRAAVVHPGLPADRDVRDPRAAAVLGLSGRVHSRRSRPAVRADRLCAGRVLADRVLQLPAADLGPGGREPGPGLDPGVRVHGRDDGAQRHRQRPALHRPGAAQAGARRAGAGGDHHGHDPRRDDRHHRRFGHHDDRARPADHDAPGLQPRAGLRHDRRFGHARHPDPALDHADHHGRPDVGLGRQRLHGGVGTGPGSGRALRDFRHRGRDGEALDGAAPAAEPALRAQRRAWHRWCSRPSCRRCS